jgi:hypothetical protein
MEGKPGRVRYDGEQAFAKVHLGDIFVGTVASKKFLDLIDTKRYHSYSGSDGAYISPELGIIEEREFPHIRTKSSIR